MPTSRPGQQDEERVEPDQVAGVLDRPLAVHGPLVEAEAHPVFQAGSVGELLLVHLPRRRGIEDARPAVAPVLEVGDHEARHVRRGRARGPGGRLIDVLERPRDGFAAPDFVARREPRASSGAGGWATVVLRMSRGAKTFSST